MIKCRQCGKHFDVKDVDEYVPPDMEDGLAIPLENLPDKTDEIHLWMNEYGNVLMHFVEDT